MNEQGQHVQSKMTSHKDSAEKIISQPNRVKAQTTREWAYEFSHGGKVWPATWGDPPKGYISVPDDFDPKFKTATNLKDNAKARVRFRL